MIELLLAADRMLAVGDLEPAERIYRQVAAADPRNAIAVVGMARVAHARGDEQGALDLARRALAIDPDEVAAQLLVDASSPARTDVTRLEPVQVRPSLLARFLAFLGLRR